MTLPSQKVLFCKSRDTSYVTVKKKVDSTLANDGFRYLTGDPWLNMNNGSVLKYMLVPPNASLLLDSVFTGEHEHGTDSIYRDMYRLMKKTLGRLSGVVMDNAAANRAVWLLFWKVYLSMFFHGCLSQGFHIFFMNNFSGTNNKHGRDCDTPKWRDGYLLSRLLVIANKQVKTSWSFSTTIMRPGLNYKLLFQLQNFGIVSNLPLLTGGLFKIVSILFWLQ